MSKQPGKNHVRPNLDALDPRVLPAAGLGHGLALTLGSATRALTSFRAHPMAGHGSHVAHGHRAAATLVRPVGALAVVSSPLPSASAATAVPLPPPLPSAPAADPGATLTLAPVSDPLLRVTAQPLSTAALSAARFDTLFQPIPTAPALTSAFELQGTSGAVQSQVFQGTGPAAGLYAYAYQLDLNGAAGAASLPGAVWHFGDTPTAADLAGGGQAAYAYTINDGAVGALSTPQASPGQDVLSPSLTWRADTSRGAIALSFPGAGLGSGGKSATVVLLSTVAPQFQQIVNLQGPAGTYAAYAAAYAPEYGTVGPIAPASQAPTLAAPAGQSLSLTDLSAAQFQSQFQPIATAPALTSAYQFVGASGTSASGTTVSGAVESRVFQGTGPAAGLYAYAYQIQAPAGQAGPQRVLWRFDATPGAADLTGSGQTGSAYVIRDGATGPTSLSWQPGAQAGTLVASFADSGLPAGTTSATLVVLSTRPPTEQWMFVPSADPNFSPGTTGSTVVYSPQPGPLGPAPGNT